MPLTLRDAAGRPSQEFTEYLAAAAEREGVPYPLAAGWVKVESGGKLTSHTSLDERGYFQLHPGESQRLRLDHLRLSTDGRYSVDAGMRLLNDYAARVAAFLSRSSPAFWPTVKFAHSIGFGGARTIVTDAQREGAAGTWDAIVAYAREREKDYFRRLKHSPTKWTENVNKVLRAGNFGLEAAGGELAIGLVIVAVVGALYLGGVR